MILARGLLIDAEVERAPKQGFIGRKGSRLSGSVGIIIAIMKFGTDKNVSIETLGVFSNHLFSFHS